MRAGLVAIVALVATGAVAATGPATIPLPIARALADPARADQAIDDDRRKAAATLAFAGVEPGDAVVDFFPGKGYWTRILAGVVGPRGHVYALWPQNMAKRAAPAIAELNGRHLANVTAQASDAPAAPRPVDLFWTVQNYHDLNNTPAGEAGLDAFNAHVFAALKPGGTYLVIDHADAPGSGLAGTNTRHRIDPATVKAEIVKAGFVFAGESAVLRNPDDDHSKNVFDPALRGHTDQFVYKFRKPR